MIAAILVLFAILSIIDVVLKKMGFFKPEWTYSLDKDVLGPLGYDAIHYLYDNDIVCILKVQKKLEEVWFANLTSMWWSFIQSDLDKNRQMERDYINSLKKQAV